MNLLSKIFITSAWPFLISIAYWSILFATAKMEIIFDAIGYRDLGRVILEQGWTEFFIIGPNREPFYPFLISLSMGLADILGIPFESIQTLMQLAFLLTTQILVFILLRRMGVRNLIAQLAVLYIGFSPALVNSALSLFSEIAAYPFVLGIVLLTPCIKEAIERSTGRTCISALLLSLLMIILLCIKAVFIYVWPAYLIALVAVLIITKSRQNKYFSSRIVVFMLISFFLPNLFVATYKSANEMHNGNRVFTNRGPWMLYATSVKRTDALSGKDMMIFMSTVPGQGVCRTLFDAQACSHWDSEIDSQIGAVKLAELTKSGLTPMEADERLHGLSFKNILNQPLQFGFMTTLESFKMFFWESTKIGCVQYPAALARLFDWGLFKNALRLIVGLATIAAFLNIICLMGFRLRNRNFTQGQDMLFLLMISAIIIPFVGLYALFTVLTRFSFPVVPLYIVLIAYSAERLIRTACHESKE